MIKRLASGLAARLGYTIVPNWQLDSFQASGNLRRLLDWCSIDLVIDVGANRGQFRDALRSQSGYRGRIVSFEPAPHLAAALAERAGADPLWEVQGRALGAAPGTAEFNVMEDSQFSSFLAPRHDEVGLFEAKNTVRERVRVAVSTVDVVLPPLIEKHAPRGVFLKLDTQGFDLEVLKGADASLGRIAALQAEMSVRPIYDGAPTYREVIDFAVSRGFVVSGFFASNPGHFPQLIDFDCQMIRREAVSR